MLGCFDLLIVSGLAFISNKDILHSLVQKVDQRPQHLPLSAAVVSRRVIGKTTHHLRSI